MLKTIIIKVEYMALLWYFFGDCWRENKYSYYFILLTIIK